MCFLSPCNTKCLKLGGINPANRLLFIDCPSDSLSASPFTSPTASPSNLPSSNPTMSPSSGAKDWTTAASNQIKITASDGAAGDLFGRSASVTGSILAIGAPNDDDKGESRGHWCMGSSAKVVSVYGNTLLVGASAADSPGVTVQGGDDIGSAYLLEKDQYNDWVEVAKLTASDSALNDGFGGTVVMDKNVILVSSPPDDDNGQESGSVYVFEKDHNNNWVEVAKLIASDVAANDYFGSAVSVDGNVVLVGNSHDDDNGPDSGSTYVLEKDQYDDWVEVSKLTASDSAAGDRFGNSVSVYENTIVVGSFLHDDIDANSGCAYVFEKDQDNDWVEVAKLTASDGAVGNYFGFS
eukprot:scaffold154708_cov36-Cyclotella_meneghiniana.AAC.1